MEDTSLDRLVFFSDAVIAIAITLLALELPVPHGDSNRQLWESAGEHSNEYASFLISFAVIAAFWMFHHWLFRFVARQNVRLIVLNLVFLLAVVVVPFVSKIFGESGDRAFGIVWYAGAISLAGLACLAMASYAIRGGLLHDGIGRGDLRRLQLQVAVPTAVFLVSIPVGLLSPAAAKLCWISTGLLSVLAGRLLGGRLPVGPRGR